MSKLHGSPVNLLENNMLIVFIRHTIYNPTVMENIAYEP